MPASEHGLLSAATVVAALGALLAAIAGHAELVAYTAPVLVLALPLLRGRYVGEERIARLRGRACRGVPRRAPLVALAEANRRALRPVPRGGRLIAAALAVRPPPAPALS
jgi:hypothetical protein